jgi:hypothetical protein
MKKKKSLLSSFFAECRLKKEETKENIKLKKGGEAWVSGEYKK